MIPRTRIQLIACGKTFADGTRAIEPLDLTVEGGETVVLLGPSGCGKTTTLRLIAGLEFPDRGGRVLFDGEDVTRLPIERRRVGMVFQSYALFPTMTVAENVGYGLRIRGDTRTSVRERVGRMLEMMHISDLADRRIAQLSGGQRQRVALARALAPEPRVLLLDEPLTALDARLRATLRTEIDTLLRSLGITAVYVTHDQEEAMALGDRIVAMDKGHIAQIGTPRDVYQHPRSRFVAEFIGTTNRLAAILRDGHLHAGGLALPLVAADVADRHDGPVEVLFRPEAVRLCDAEEAHASGPVEASFFLGDRLRLTVAAPWGAVTVDAPPRTPIAVGETVHLRLDPAGLMPFAMTAASSALSA